MTNEEMTLDDARFKVKAAERALAKAVDDVDALERGAELEDGIVTFEARIFNPEVFRSGGDNSLVICHEALDNLGDTGSVHVAVSPKPFASYPGVEVARGALAAHVFAGGMAGILTNSGYEDITKFVSKHAKPGNIVAIIDPGSGK